MTSLNGGADDDVLNGGLGDDALTGGAGIDTASYVDETTAMFVDLAAGTARRGSAGAAIEDTLYGIENVTGGSGADGLTGSTAANILDGGAGNDVLLGGGGADTILGDAGDDAITGGAGNDTLSGGDGDDTFTYNFGDGADSVDGGAGIDTLNIIGTALPTRWTSSERHLPHQLRGRHADRRRGGHGQSGRWHGHAKLRRLGSAVSREPGDRIGLGL